MSATAALRPTLVSAAGVALPRAPASAASAPAALDSRIEIILVDDGNPPADAARLWALAGDVPGCSVVRLSRNRGQQPATLAGIRAASGRIIVTMDDDGGHPPELVPRMVAALRRADLVYGVPDALHARSARALGSRVNRAVFRLFLGVRRGIAVTSFRAFRSDLLPAADRQALGPQLARTRTRPAPGRPAPGAHRAGRQLPPNISAMLLGRSPRTACIAHAAVASSATRHSAFSLMWALGVLTFFWAPRGLIIRALSRRHRGSRPVPADGAGGRGLS